MRRNKEVVGKIQSTVLNGYILYVCSVCAFLPFHLPQTWIRSEQLGCKVVCRLTDTGQIRAGLSSLNNTIYVRI